MPQLDSTKQLKAFYRQTFELRNSGATLFRHTLLVNPEDMSQQEPARVNVVQTLGGAYVDDFGQGLPTVTISGVTGYKARYNAEGEQKDGYTEFSDFRENIYRKFIKENEPDYELRWYNWEDDEFYQVQPTSFRMMRNKQSPTMYRYEFQFTCIRKLVNNGILRLGNSYMTNVDGQQLIIGQSLSGLGETMYKFKSSFYSSNL